MTIREELEELEYKFLHPRAKKSKESKGRIFPEKPCELRTAFQRDRDRIIHSKAFRRLKHKTQVFLSPSGDHYRTRLTHTLEVSQIARTIAVSLRLNETLTEAIALGHDLGHTPFGHSGEEALDEIFKDKGGFRHYEHSLRVVDKLENEGRGLNLTYEVREGILKHSKGIGEIYNPSEMAETLEGQIIRFADVIAYINHDIEDAIRAGIITNNDIPSALRKILGETKRERIDKMVKDVVHETIRSDYEAIKMSSEIYSATMELKEFMYKNVYFNEVPKGELKKIKKILKDIYEVLIKDPEKYGVPEYPVDDSVEQRIIDYLAGMTDRFAINLYNEIFIPKPWEKI